MRRSSVITSDQIINSFTQILDLYKSSPDRVRHPLRVGSAFLGAYILPYRVYPGKRIAHNFRECLCSPDPDPEKQIRRVASYQGMLKHFNSIWFVRGCVCPRF